MKRIEYLGHAGFVVQFHDVRILIDPWFYPAFLASWFPLPDNRFLMEHVRATEFDYLYISHTHEDHLDVKFLSTLDKNVNVLCAGFRSQALAKRLGSLGFRRLTTLSHRQSLDLAPGLRATMYLDTGHKEDSALLLEMDEFRFFDMNDCNTPLSELPSDVDLLAAQYSGAMWYPNCYVYPAPVMADKVQQVRADLLDNLVRKASVTNAAAYLPSAGPACFLDPVLAHFNDSQTTIFPHWEDVAGKFAALRPETQVTRLFPGDALTIQEGAMVRECYPRPRASDSLEEYAERRRPEWEAFHAAPEQPIQREEIEAYYRTLQQRNRHLLQAFSKIMRLEADGQSWIVRLGEQAGALVAEGGETLEPGYVLQMPTRVLRAILAGSTGWEEALLSMRIRLHRDPDRFDATFMGLLRYGNEPLQTLHMVKERQRKETIERDGLRMQRFCPHAGEDLQYAKICNGIIECPRHHWQWDAATGECIAGGTLKLNVETLSSCGDAR